MGFAMCQLTHGARKTMNLLPKSRTEFGDTQYWNKFFKQRGKKAFDWYGEYPELCGQLHKYVRTKDEVLMLGCGNSSLSADLYDVGYKQMTNIDISHVVIKQMMDLHRLDRPGLSFTQMDATALTYADQSFSAAIDKGTLDALMPDNDPQTVATVDKYFDEISRVLRIGGRYVCVSLLQEHILRKVIDYFPARDFMLRIVRCWEAEEKTKADNPDGFAMPVFLIVATKFSKLPMRLLEVNLLMGDEIQRVSTAEDLFEAVDAVQKAALVCSNLNKSRAALDEEIRIDLMEPGKENEGKAPRYTIIVVDQEGKRKFAAFIVPQGKECEWLFATKDGRKKLLASAGFGRLAIVLLHRDHEYVSLDAIKEELSAHVKQLAPNNLKRNELIPFLSLGGDVGERTVLHRGNSKFSGDYVVEDVAMESGEIFRRLIFLNNEFVIQSEALVKLTKKKNKTKKVVDLTYLACQHHLYMTFGTVAATKSKKEGANVLVVGLGGGGLCTFIQQVSDSVKITAVDIDETMLDVATEYFGLTISENFDVKVADGVEFMRSARGENRTFDAILFDVDSKDSSLGISCPPKQFIEEETLTTVKECLEENGLFVLNLVCRDDELKASILETLSRMFAVIVSYKLEDEVNEILFCSKSQAMDLKRLLGESIDLVNECIKKQKLNDGDTVDLRAVEKKLKELKV